MPGLVFETFEIELQNTLYRFYDPIYTPEASIYEVAGVAPAASLEVVRGKIIKAVEEMNSDSEVPETAKIAILYKILLLRFVQSLSQEKVAEILGISARHVRRKQNEAIHALATRMWHRHYPPGETGPLPPVIAEKTAPVEEANVSWTDSVLREIEVLSHASPGVTTDLEKVVRRAVEMAGYLRKPAAVAIEVGELQANLEIPIHPNVLREVILYIIDKLLLSNDTGPTRPIRLTSGAGPAKVAIGFLFWKDARFDAELPNIQALAGIVGGKAELTASGDQASLDLVFQRSRKVSVMVVDDNREIVQLYRRFTANTRYEIYQPQGDMDLLDQIKGFCPDILVIDVLLPGIDGWDLLIQLRQESATRGIPVIVCSVLGNADMARSLGANGYLPKPVDRQSLLQTFEALSGTTFTPPVDT